MERCDQLISAQEYQTTADRYQKLAAGAKRAEDKRRLSMLAASAAFADATVDEVQDRPWHERILLERIWKEFESLQYKLQPRIQTTLLLQEKMLTRLAWEIAWRGFTGTDFLQSTADTM